jgi:hypothetical protein
MERSIFFFELVVFYALALGWAIWEYRKVSKLHKKTLEEEGAKSSQSAAEDQPE